MKQKLKNYSFRASEAEMQEIKNKWVAHLVAKKEKSLTFGRWAVKKLMK